MALRGRDIFVSAGRKRPVGQYLTFFPPLRYAADSRAKLLNVGN